MWCKFVCKHTHTHTHLSGYEWEPMDVGSIYVRMCAPELLKRDEQFSNVRSSSSHAKILVYINKYIYTDIILDHLMTCDIASCM